MMDKMILGRYIPGNSWLHKLDPRAKITAVMAFIAIVFSEQLADVCADVSLCVVSGVNIESAIFIFY